MKSLKGILVLGVAVIGFTTFAQTEKEKLTPEERAKKVTQKLQKKLKLDDAQTKKIEAVNLENIQKKRALQEELKALKGKIKALKEERTAQYKSILTPEQYTQLEQMIEDRKEKKKEKGPKGKGQKGK